MNKYIKQLTESLFDDIDDIFSDDEEDDVMSDIIASYNSIEIDKLFANIDDNKTFITPIKELLRQYNTWIDMAVDAHKQGPLEVRIIKLSVYFKTIEPFKVIFDMLLKFNIKIHFGVFYLELDNTTPIIHNINEIIDFDKYKSIFQIDSFVISKGAIKDFTGVPTYINEELVLDWVTGQYTMNNFPNTENALQLTFDNSWLPSDWTGTPDKLQNIQLTINNVDRFATKYKFDDKAFKLCKEYISKYLKEFTNFPLNIKLIKNSNNNHYIGCLLINPNWNLQVREYTRNYISACLKKQYKTILPLKRLLCSTWYR